MGHVFPLLPLLVLLLVHLQSALSFKLLPTARAPAPCTPCSPCTPFRSYPLSATLDVDTGIEEASSADTYKAPEFEILRRRNFAIISHPDAGKTTLTPTEPPGRTDPPPNAPPWLPWPP
jgi:hypothetical protein